MEKRNMIIITIVAVACIAMTALYFSGAIHTGSFAAQGAKFGPGRQSNIQGIFKWRPFPIRQQRGGQLRSHNKNS
ncbi:hypothetical protein [uncultured Methanobrevibacter sp.]|uniref:hypothetical protein n=1 Tax=uncultured Methanobrevibacter sp. TaxID=253161 RepID=UPI0025D948E9|nr:hypothetical protein [uncultured Methanobrevibacter sp.]